MAHEAVAIADGQLPGALGGLFTVGAGQRLYLHLLTVYNRSALAQTVVIEVNRTGANRRWKRWVLNQDESGEAPSNGRALILEAGDSIQGSATSGGTVDYTISGVIES